VRLGGRGRCSSGGSGRAYLREAYVLELSRYVVLNPVRVGWVRSPEEWIWSSYSATIGLERCPRFLHADGLLAWHGGGREARSTYARFVRDAIGVPASDEAFLDM
jgi:putative transposase